MAEYFQSPAAQAVVWIAASAVLFLVGFYVVGKVRGSLREEEPGANELLTNFRELHSRGELSDGEYRTIKAMLAARLQQELKDSGKEG